MDGVEKPLRPLKNSLQSRLSLWLSLAIVGVALVAGAFSFLAAFDEAQELQDDVLRQMATLFDADAAGALPHLGVEHLQAALLADRDGDSRVFVRRLSGSPAGIRTEGDAVALPAVLPDGLQTVDVGPESFRVMVKTLGSGERVALAQHAEARNEIARNSALRTLMPFLVLVPILLWIVASLVRAMFRPIATLSAEVDRRGDRELHALDTAALPSEVRPFVDALNRLLERAAQSMDAQRRFVADAAHELRSPLTALSLQAERLADAEMSDPARQRFAALRLGIERGRSLLDQMLTLARVQSRLAEAKATDTVSVHRVYRRVLEDLMPLAEARNMNIGLADEADAQVRANEAELVTLVKNLVDNAIRYTPDGGRIDLSVHAGDGVVVLRVADSGPGIPPGERRRVFDPFYRIVGHAGIGSGLGLSIVDAIAGRMGARVSLEYADERACKGLVASVELPLGGDGAAQA